MATRAWLLVTALALGLAVAVFCCLPLRFEIESPRFSHPVIATPGERFELTVKASLPWWSPDWRVDLVAASGSLELPVVARGNRGTRSRLLVEIPKGAADTREGHAYDLRVRAGAREDLREHAVHVRDRIPSDFTLLQLADLVMLSQPGAAEDMDRLVEEVNLVNPDLVLVTGDVVKGGGPGFSAAIEQWLLRIRSPTIIAAGNHEYDDLAGFQEIFGSANHVTPFGDWRIITVHTGHGRDQFTTPRFRWLADQILAEPDARKILQMHHPLVGPGAVQNRAAQVLRLIGSNRVELVLFGHIQEDSVYDLEGRRRRGAPDFAGPKLVTTTAAGDEVRNKNGFEKTYSGYRLIRIEDGKVVTYTHDLDGDGRADPERSTPWGTVTRKLHPPNRAVVRNRSNLSVDARVELETAFPAAVASVGEIVATEPAAEGAWRQRVAIRLDPGGQVEVGVEPAPAKGR